jgi:putative nucleotidyltransferase with HDIG domain
MGVSKLAEELRQICVKRIATDTLVIPTIPGIVARAQDVLRAGESGLRHAPEVIEQEPFLVARALRLAGGGGASNGKRVTLADALNRIGPRGVKQLLSDATAQKAHLSRDPEIAAAQRKTWEHAVAVGTLARDVLALSGHPDSEAAYLAGILHDVGKPVVVSLLGEAERQTTELYGRGWIQSGDWVNVVAQVHRPVGLALAEKWQFPEQVVRCMQESVEYDNADRASLSNAVCFANALAKKTGVYVGPFDAEDVDAIVMIGRSLIGVSDEVLKTLTKGLKDRVTGLFD